MQQSLGSPTDHPMGRADSSVHPCLARHSGIRDICELADVVCGADVACERTHGCRDGRSFFPDADEHFFMALHQPLNRRSRVDPVWGNCLASVRDIHLMGEKPRITWPRCFWQHADLTYRRRARCRNGCLRSPLRRMRLLFPWVRPSPCVLLASNLHG